MISKWNYSLLALRNLVSIIVFAGFSMAHGAGAQVVQVEFGEAEGFADGDINDHPQWASFTAANVVDVSGSGRVILDADTPWINTICTAGMPQTDSRLSVSIDFSFTETSAGGRGDLFSLIALDSLHMSTPDMRTAVRRVDGFYLLFFKSADGTQRFSPRFPKSDLGLDGTLGDASDELSLSMTLHRGNDPTDWTVVSVLSNLSQSVEVLTFENRSIGSTEVFFDASHQLFGFSSALEEIKHGTANRVIDRFRMERVLLSAAPPEQKNPRSEVEEAQAAIPSQTFEPALQLPASNEVPFSDIPQTLKEFGILKEGLLAKLSALPALNETLQFEAYGYHGGYLPEVDVLPDKPRWTLDFSFNPNISLSQVILVPAVDHRYGNLSSYGFPVRFRVMTVADDGRVHVAKEWMDADCPDPGRYPLVIDVPHAGDHKVRIEVYRGCEDGGREMLALDELYGVMGIADQPCLSVTASSEFESPPYWSKRFLTDRKTSLGLPLDVGSQPQERRAGKDFAAAFDEPPADGCVIELDMGENRKLGWIALFPAQSSQGIMTPGFGFPGSLSLEIVQETKEGTRGRSRRVPWDWTRQRPGNNMFRMSGADLSGRWMRIHLGDLPLHAGKPTSALGEIQVYRQETTYPIKQIRLEGFPEGAESNVQLMMNGESGGYPVLFLLDWLHKIEQRKQLSQSLDALSALEQSLRFRWRHFWQISAVAIGMLIVLLAVSTAILTVVSRRRQSKALRRQISSDLHDDIGSKVAAISLASTYVEQHASEPLVCQRGSRIRTIASDMHQGLRDVLWLTDTRTDTLDQVVQKLIDSARAGIAAERLSLKTTPISSITPRLVGVQVKRDLLLFFKEALHNAASHSDAPRISVEILQQGRKLHLKVEDSGTGFDQADVESSAPEHHGLSTMRERGKRLHGQLSIDTVPGTGTIVELTVAI